MSLKRNISLLRGLKVRRGIAAIVRSGAVTRSLGARGETVKRHVPVSPRPRLSGGGLRLAGVACFADDKASPDAAASGRRRRSTCAAAPPHHGIGWKEVRRIAGLIGG